MKVLLINPPSRFWLFPPLGLAYIAAYIKNYYTTSILDMIIEPEKLQETLCSFSPDIIGITCTSQTFQDALKVAKEVKEHDKTIKVVMGGSHPSAIPEKTLKHPEIDFVIKGEGEKAFLEICQGKHKEGIVEGGLIIDINNLPWPSRELLPMSKYDTPGTILTSRGCPHRCCYCAHHVSGYTWRGRKPNDVVNEISHIVDTYGIKDIQVIDDNFSMDMNRAKEIMKLIIERKMNISLRFYNGLRADRIDEELLTLMKEAGTKLISFGLESTDKTILKNIEKRVTLHEVENAINMVHKKGIQVRVSLMIGNSGETYKMAMRTIKWAKENPNIDATEFSLCTAYPNTPLWKWVMNNGKILVDSEHYPTYFLDKEVTPSFDTPEFSAEERVKALRIAQKQMARKFAFKNKSLRNFKFRNLPKYISTVITITFNITPKRKFKADKN